MEVSPAELEQFRQWKAAGQPMGISFSGWHTSYRLHAEDGAATYRPADVARLCNYSEKRILQLAQWTVDHHNSSSGAPLLLRKARSKHPYVYLPGGELLEIVSRPSVAKRRGRPPKGQEWLFAERQEIEIPQGHRD